MADHLTIGTLWVEGPLSFLEQVCLVSFRDAGHPVRLYTYGEVTHIPEGIEVRSASEIVPRDGFLTHAATGSSALHSDLFRYKLFEREPGIVWADTDVYCISPLRTRTGHLHGFEQPDVINGAILALPPESATLKSLLEFTADEYAIPPFARPGDLRAYHAAAAAGRPVHVGEMRWGVWGPHALTHFLRQTGEVRETLPEHVFYPFSFRDRRKMLEPRFDTAGHILPDTVAIHFYGRRMRRRLIEREGGIPHPESLLGRLLGRHGIDPLAAPIPPGPALPKGPHETDIEAALPRRKPASGAPAASGAAAMRPTLPAEVPNLSDIADRHGSDKGSAKHRYTELYHLLFLPLRDRPIRLLEMGLQIGGPEHGKPAGRQTTDLPSVRMWLEYFPRAEIVGLDVSDFGWFRDPRFRFIRCDMEMRDDIAAAAASAGEFDIIIDDASHASHHQQTGFLEFWPRLRRGGIYIIEDLGWQPEAYERVGFTKTAELWQSYLSDRAFSHSDPELAAAFNALRPEFSGVFVHQHRYLKRRRDQVAIIHKR